MPSLGRVLTGSDSGRGKGRKREAGWYTWQGLKEQVLVIKPNNFNRNDRRNNTWGFNTAGDSRIGVGDLHILSAEFGDDRLHLANDGVKRSPPMRQRRQRR